MFVCQSILKHCQYQKIFCLIVSILQVSICSLDQIDTMSELDLLSMPSRGKFRHQLTEMLDFFTNLTFLLPKKSCTCFRSGEASASASKGTLSGTSSDSLSIGHPWRAAIPGTQPSLAHWQAWHTDHATHLEAPMPRCEDLPGARCCLHNGPHLEIIGQLRVDHAWPCGS